MQFTESASPDIPFQANAADAFSNVNIREEKITSAYIVKTLRQNGWDGVTMDVLPVLKSNSILLYKENEQ